MVGSSRMRRAMDRDKGDGEARREVDCAQEDRNGMVRVRYQYNKQARCVKKVDGIKGKGRLHYMFGRRWTQTTSTRYIA